MSTLREHLEHLSHRDLRAIATRLDVRRQGEHRKSFWLESVLEFWCDPQRRSSFLSSFSPSAKMALHRLCQADVMPAVPFFGEYGYVRHAAPGLVWTTLPWRAPANASEELFYAGLLASQDLGRLDEAQRVTVPSDVRAWLLDIWRQPSGLAGGQTARQPTPPPMALVHDVGQFLIYLCEHPDLASAHSAPPSRWLPPAHLARLNDRLLCPAPSPLPPSHKRCVRARLLAFLAEAGGLVRGRQITPMGWEWLACSPTRQLGALWDAWQYSTQDVRAAYGQPTARLPRPWPDPLLEALARQRSCFTAPHLSDDLLGSSVGLYPYFAAHLPDLLTLDRAIEAELLGTLAAFGVIAVEPAKVSQGAAWPTVDANATHFMVTPAGKWFLRNRRGRPPGVLGAAQLSGRAVLKMEEASCQVRLPPLGHLAQQARVGLFGLHRAFRTGESQGQACHLYELRPESLARAAGRGHGLASLIGALQDAGVVLIPDVISQLQQWHAAGTMLEIMDLSVLRMASVTLMQQLRETRGLDKVLGEMLSPTLVTLTEPPARARQALNRAGFHARILTADTGPGSSDETHSLPSGPADPVTAPLPRPDAGLWLAGQVYALLGEHLALPMPPPFARLADELASFSAAEARLLQSQWHDLRERILDLLDGQAFMPPPTPSDPARWLPIIETAIADGRYLEMDYFTAGRNVLTHRTVEPYLLKWRDGELYLEGFCQLADAVRRGPISGSVGRPGWARTNGPLGPHSRGCLGA